VAARADAARADHGRDQINDEPEQHQRREQQQRRPADALEVLDPGRQQRAEEDRDDAGHRRQHRAGEAHDDEHYGADPRKRDEHAGMLSWTPSWVDTIRWLNSCCSWR
jgi:hypothetical protein